MDKYFAVYIMASARNGTLYTGITSNLPKRVGMEAWMEVEVDRGKNPEWRDLFQEICQ